MPKKQSTEVVPPAEQQRAQHIVIRTLNVCKDACVKRYDTHYHPRHQHGHIHLILDTIMVMVIVMLMAGLVGFVRVGSPSAPLTLAPHSSVIPPTQLRATAAVRLATLEGDPLWAGPLPPVVGRETRLRVFFEVSGIKSTHRNLVFTATIPEPIVATDRAVANRGSIYIVRAKPVRRVESRTTDVTNDHTIRWELGNVGTETSVQASVELSVTSTMEDAGSSLPLLTGVVLTGEDTAIRPVRLELPDVSTASLPNNLGVVTK